MPLPDPMVAAAREAPRAQRPTEPRVEQDGPLVTAAQGGDRTAFSALYRKHARLVHGLLLARVPVAVADDLVQEVFLQAWTKLPELRDPAAFVGWLITIVRRRAADHHRRAKETARLPDVLTSHDAPRAEAMAVIDAIRRLPEPYIEPLMLRLVEGMSGQEIAERTGLTHGSVRVNLSRGFRLLRERLGEDEG